MVCWGCDRLFRLRRNTLEENFALGGKGGEKVFDGETDKAACGEEGSKNVRKFFELTGFGFAVLKGKGKFRKFGMSVKGA